jgi:hypothetical protein
MKPWHCKFWYAPKVNILHSFSATIAHGHVVFGFFFRILHRTHLPAHIVQVSLYFWRAKGLSHTSVLD